MLEWKRMEFIMSKCKICNVQILDPTEKCPFCNCVLEEPDLEKEPAYPYVAGKVRKFNLLGNIVLFLSLLIGTILFACNMAFDPDFLWSIIVILSMAYVNIVLRLAIIGKNGYMYKTLCLVIIAIGILIGIDYVVGYRGWALNIVFPSGILLLDLAIIILMIVNHRNWQSYMMVQILTALLGLFATILAAVGVVTFPYLAWLSLGVSAFLFLGTLIIGDQRARTELRRRFHI